MGAQLPLPSGQWLNAQIVQQAQQFQNAWEQQQLGNYQQALGMQAAYQEQLELMHLSDAEWLEYMTMRRGRPGPRLGTRFGATERAEKTLDRFLTPDQRRDLRYCGWFDVEGKGKLKGKLGFRSMQTRHYRIYQAGPLVNEMLPRGKFQHLCIMALENLPKADIMLSWKLLIEADLEKFVKTANRIGAPHM